MAEARQIESDILIKRYAKRRLYNTVDLVYVSMDDLTKMVLAQQQFIIRDAETGDDITREILGRLH